MTNIDKLIDSICNTKYETKGFDGDKFEAKVVYDLNAKLAIAKTVYEWASTQLSDIEKDKQIEVLKAKCFAYEQIIANSNFAPVLIKENEDE